MGLTIQLKPDGQHHADHDGHVALSAGEPGGSTLSKVTPPSVVSKDRTPA